jgi:pimeloyl-ACP methyl ester carboxylesterase
VARSYTRYARSGDVHVAYRVFGEGPFDLVFASGMDFPSVEFHDHAAGSDFSELTDRMRVVRFDKRGTGASDRVSGVPSLEERMDDVRAVMDAVGVERAALLGHVDGAAMAILFAATYPEQTASLVLHGSTARFLWAPDYPWAPTRDEIERQIDRFRRTWGTQELVEDELASVAPSLLLDEVQTRQWAAARRLSASPGSAAALARMNMEIDVRHILPTLTVPTLVIHRSHDKVHSVDGARWMARQIPGAHYVELQGPTMSRSQATPRNCSWGSSGLSRKRGRRALLPRASAFSPPFSSVTSLAQRRRRRNSATCMA